MRREGKSAQRRTYQEARKKEEGKKTREICTNKGGEERK